MALLELAAVEHKLEGLVLKEGHRRIALQQQRQLQQQQHVQKLLANGLRLWQLEQELDYLEEQHELVKKQENQLEV